MISRIIAAFAATLIVLTTVVNPTPTYAQDNPITSEITGSSTIEAPHFTRSMVFSWCNNPENGSGTDRWCSGKEFDVSNNTVIITADEGSPLQISMKLWQLRIIEPNTYNVSYKITWADGSVDEYFVDPSFVQEVQMNGVRKMEIFLESV